jgi:hypothetical protein
MRKPWVGSCFHHDIHFNEDWPLENDSKGIPAPPESQSTQHGPGRLSLFWLLEWQLYRVHHGLLSKWILWESILRCKMWIIGRS